MRTELIQETVKTNRDVEAFLVPTAVPIVIPKDTEVTITQALGGSYTLYVNGNLVRVDGKDGDALGKEIIDPFEGIDLENASVEDLVQAQLRSCYDPEIPVNIVDLGLVYECHVTPLGKNEYAINIKMTLTAPGCGMGPILAEEVKQRIKIIPQVKQVEVELVFDPPWDQSMMSDVAKLQLGIL